MPIVVYPTGHYNPTSTAVRDCGCTANCTTASCCTTAYIYNRTPDDKEPRNRHERRAARHRGH